MSFKSSYIAFHEHFNYIVMHFRYVLYMLSCFVLVGLDWAEPMMFLNLHAYAYAFSCVRTFSFSYSYILLCWYFYGNPLRSRTSFSSEPTHSSVRFRDENAQKDFSKNFCK